MIYNFLHIIPVLFFLTFSANVSGQEINFGEYSSRYTISPILIQSTLDFGTIAQNQGVKERGIDEAAIIELEGIKYLDVLVDIEVLSPFQTEGCDNTNCTLPFTMKAAYSNFGANNEVSAQSNVILIGETTIDYSQQTGLLSTQFPILHRTTAPPGPPPAPDYEGRDLEAQKESAYLFIYGSVEASGLITGEYSTNIQVSIYYD